MKHLKASGEGDMPGRLEHPSKSLTPQAHYEELATAFGGKGYFCVTPEELEAALDESMASRPYKPTIINTMISLTSLRKKQTAPSLCAPHKSCWCWQDSAS